MTAVTDFNENDDILRSRQKMWDRFTFGTKIAIALTIVTLVALAMIIVD